MTLKLGLRRLQIAILRLFLQSDFQVSLSSETGTSPSQNGSRLRIYMTNLRLRLRVEKITNVLFTTVGARNVPIFSEECDIGVRVCRSRDVFSVYPLCGWNLSDRIRSAMAA